MNIENINKLIAVLESEERVVFEGAELSFNMKSYMRPIECETLACIAGYAFALSGVDIQPDDYDEYNCFEKVAMDWLGIDRITAQRLFTTWSFGIHSTDERFAVQRLKELRDTGNVSRLDWIF